MKGLEILGLINIITLFVYCAMASYFILKNIDCRRLFYVWEAFAYFIFYTMYVICRMFNVFGLTIEWVMIVIVPSFYMMAVAVFRSYKDAD